MSPFSWAAALPLLEDAGAQDAFFGVKGVILYYYIVNGEGVGSLAGLVNLKHGQPETISRSLDRPG